MENAYKSKDKVKPTGEEIPPKKGKDHAKDAYEYATAPLSKDEYDPIYDKVWELDDTATLMTEDYRKRFIAEYLQAKIRYERLRIFLAKWRACQLKDINIRDVVGFVPTTPLSVLEDQAEFMDRYLRVLEVRAAIDDIDLKRIKYRL